MPLCGRLHFGSDPIKKKPCFLTTASPICLRMPMGWQVAQRITILQPRLKHVLALKHSWRLGQRRCNGYSWTKHWACNPVVVIRADGHYAVIPHLLLEQTTLYKCRRWLLYSHLKDIFIKHNLPCEDELGLACAKFRACVEFCVAEHH